MNVIKKISQQEDKGQYHHIFKIWPNKMLRLIFSKAAIEAVKWENQSKKFHQLIEFVPGQMIVVILNFDFT